LLTAFSFSYVLAQAPPQGFTYQAVARNPSGNVLASTAVTVRIGILNTSASGPLLYQEQHNVTTNQFGLFTVTVGLGSQTGGGAFQSIPWSSDLKFMKVEVNFGSGFENMGTTQLWSVPYALYSQRSAIADSVAGGGGGGISYSAGAGINIAGSVISNTGDVNTADDITTSTTAGGDLTGTYPNPSLVNSGVTANVYGSATQIPVITVDSKGRITNATTVTGAGGASYTAGTGINIAGTVITNTGDVNATDDITTSTTAGGDLTGTYPNPSLVNSGVTANVYGSATQIPVITVDSKGRITNATTVSVSAGGGGGTLDAAYDFGGAGAGRIITVDNGPVQLNASGTNTAGLGILMTGIGNSINAVNNNAANQYSVIQVQTNSSVANNSGIFSSTTGAARSIVGQVEATSTADVGIRGLNLRTTGGIGIEGVGYNGISGQTNYSSGIAIFGENFDLVAPFGLGIGVGGSGYYGVVGEDRYLGGVAGAYGVYSNGNLGATGTKTFRIDHPLDPLNKYLIHFSIESNEVLNMYRGTAVCDANGEAEVTMPGYFEAINTNFSYHLTPVGAFAGVYVKEKMANGKFRIAGGQPGMEVCWQVYSERNDLYMQMHPEMKKAELDKSSREQGKYLMPSLYGQSKEQGIFFRDGLKR